MLGLLCLFLFITTYYIVWVQEPNLVEQTYHDTAMFRVLLIKHISIYLTTAKIQPLRFLSVLQNDLFSRLWLGYRYLEIVLVMVQINNTNSQEDKEADRLVRTRIMRKTTWRKNAGSWIYRNPLRKIKLHKLINMKSQEDKVGGSKVFRN